MKVFVYDKSANDGEQFTYKKDISAEDLAVILSEISTMENNAVTGADGIADAAKKCSLVFTYFQNYSSNLTSLYIIK